MLNRQSHGPPIPPTGIEAGFKTVALAIVAPAVLAIIGAFLALQIDNAKLETRVGQLREAQHENRSIYREGLLRVETSIQGLDGRLRLLERRP